MYERAMTSEIAYSTTCTWWDDIEKADVSVNGVLLCPHCGNQAYPAPNQTVRQARMGWDRQVDEWGRGQCFPDATARLLAWYRRMQCPRDGL